MLDIEALGNGQNGLIVSIGGVWFDPYGTWIGNPFHANISIQDALDNGAEVEGSTIRWWMEQPREAWEALFKPEPMKESLALHRLREWCAPLRLDSTKQTAGIWGHGVNYDLRMLHAAYCRHGQRLPWPFRSERDTRTLFAAAGDVAWGTSDLPKHHPVGDAWRQAGAVQNAYAKLGLKP